MPSRRIKLAITCRFLISIDSAVNSSGFSAHRIHLCSSFQVSATAADVIVPSPTCLGLISRRGVRIGIGTSINTEFEAPILSYVSEPQYDQSCFQKPRINSAKPGSLRRSIETSPPFRSPGRDRYHQVGFCLSTSDDWRTVFSDSPIDTELSTRANSYRISIGDQVVRQTAAKVNPRSVDISATGNQYPDYLKRAAACPVG